MYWKHDCLGTILLGTELPAALSLSLPSLSARGEEGSEGRARGSQTVPRPVFITRHNMSELRAAHCSMPVPCRSPSGRITEYTGLVRSREPCGPADLLADNAARPCLQYYWPSAYRPNHLNHLNRTQTVLDTFHSKVQSVERRTREASGHTSI